MKDQVVMSKNNGELCVAIPLFRVHHQESLGSTGEASPRKRATEGRSLELEKLGEYRIFLTKEKPTAYVLEHPEFGSTLKLFNAEFIENNMEFLGELGDDELEETITLPQGEQNGSSDEQGQDTDGNKES